MSTQHAQATVAASGRPRCTVGLDLRQRSSAGAVAVDRRGRVRAWASIEGEEDRISLAKRALEALSVRTTELRVLLGSESTRVAAYQGATAPEASQIAEALAAEGYEPILAPAVAAVSAEPGSWLVAGCEEEDARSLAEALAELVATQPKLVVDQLLLLQHLRSGSAALESADTGLIVVTRPSDSAPLVRSLPTAFDGERAQAEALRTLEMTGGAGNVWLLGAQRDELRQFMEHSGLEPRHEVLPVCGPHRIPSALELAWRVAVAREAPALRSPRLEAGRRSLLWARRAAVIAITITILSAIVVAFSVASALRIQARKSRDRGELVGIEEQLRQLREASALAQKVQQLYVELGAQSLSWPQLVGPISDLARKSPPEIGWERLAVADGELELEVSAAEPAALEHLDLMRFALGKCAGIGNVAWEEPVLDEHGPGMRQVFRATILTLPPSAGQEAP